MALDKTFFISRGLDVGTYGQVIDSNGNWTGRNIEAAQITGILDSAEVRGLVSGGTGIDYNSSTGEFSIPASGVVAGIYGSASEIPVLTVDAQGFVDSIGTVTVAGVTGLTYDSANGNITITTADGGTFTDNVNLSPFSTTDLAEGTNLYYTDARAQAAITGGTGVTVTNGEVAIGQPVGTTDNVTFANVTVNGTLGTDDITAATVTASGNVVIQGNLTVYGTQTVVNSTAVSINDTNIILADSATNATEANGAGLTVNGANATITYASATDTWNFNKGIVASTFTGDVTGDVTGTVSDISNHSTDDLSEGSTNLYYTDARSRAAVSAGTGLAYNSTTGEFSVPASGVTAGTYGSGSLIPVVTVDAQGFVDSIGTVAVAGVTGLTYDSANGNITITTADGGSFTDNVTLSPFSTTDLAEGTNLYYTTARANSDFDTRLATKSTTDLAEGTNLYYTDARFDARLATKSTTDLTEGTNLYYTDARARGAVSVTDAGGDGSLTYNSTTGVFTYTGPSAAEVRAHFTGGTGVTITDGFIAIGQDVSTTADVTFGSVTTTGNMVIGGNLQVTGTTTTVNTQNLSIADNMFYLNQLESAGSPTISVDVGWAANYNDDGSYAHTGIFRDATDNTYKIYQGYTPEPDSALEIDTAHASFALAPLAVSTITGKYLGFDSDFAAKSTTDLTEGTNLYYTDARFDARLATKSTDDVAEGTNLYYTDARFDTRLATKTTDDVAEGSTNLYYTDARARGAVSAGTGLSYNSTTGEFSVPASGVTAGTYGSGSVIPVITVDAQGFVDSIGTVSVAGVDSLAFDSATGQLTITTSDGGVTGTTITLDPFTTSNLVEGTNLYYTDARARAAVSGGTGVTYDSATGVIAIGQAVGTTDNVTFANVTVNGTLGTDDITAATVTASGNVIVQGDLTVNGTTTTVNTETINLADNLIVLNSNETGTPSQNGGIEIERGTEANKTLVWDEANDYWTVGSETFVAASFTGDLTGDVTGTVSDISNHTTTDLTEGTNLYYTDARSRAAVSAVDAGGDGSFAYNSSTGVFTYTGPSAAEARAHFSAGTGLSYNSSTGEFSVPASGVTAGTYGSGSLIPVITVDAQGFVDSIGTVAVAGVTGLTYDSANGNLTITTADGGSFTDNINLSPFSTTDLAEGTNLYYTDARAQAAITGGTGVTVTNGVVAIGQAVGTTDNVTFNNVTVNGQLATDDVTASTVTASGDVVIQGNLTVNGTQTIVNSTAVSINDLNLVLADSATTAAEANGAGITINGANATIVYASNQDAWDFNKPFINPLIASANVLTNYSTNQLQEGANNLYYTAGRVDSDITNTVTKTFVDALNINADTLDNEQGTYYLDYTNFTNTPNVLDSADVTSITEATVDSDYINSKISGIVETRDYVAYIYQPTTATTTYSGADINNKTLGYDVGKLEVFANGVRLVNGLDYTATDGTSVTLNQSFGSGDTIVISSFGKVVLPTYEVQPAAASLVTTNVDQVVDTFSATTTRSAKYFVQFTEGSRYHSQEVLLIHDGTNVYMTSYAGIFTESDLGDVNADISGGNVRLLVTPNYANTDVKIKRIDLEV